MKKYLINVDGGQHEVEVEEVLDNSTTTKAPVSRSKPKSTRQSKIPSAPQKEKKEVVVNEDSEVVSAPMPGTILSVNVAEGDEVKAGDILLILEAMKMENEILAPRDGKVSSIGTAKGVSVNTGDKLIVID